MGTEMVLSYVSLRAQLESEKSSLSKIDESIKKVVQSSGRQTDRFNNLSEQGRGRIVKNFSFDNGRNNSFDNGRNNSFDNGRNNSFDNGRNNSFDNGRNNSFDNVRNTSFDNTRNNSFENARNHSFDNARNHSFDNARNISFDIDKNNSFGNEAHTKPEELGFKRKQETKTVFSRLSGRPGDSDNEDEPPGIKRTRVSSMVTRELPTKQQVLKAQGTDEQSKLRNRRMFGSLLGTLQKFKQEEIGLKPKEEKKAQVEKKIEEQQLQEKENMKKARESLFQEREQKKAAIRVLEAKMHRVQEYEKWEAAHKLLANFILTRSKPHIYWLPRKMCDKASEKFNSSRRFNEKILTKKQKELQDDLMIIEQKCLKPLNKETCAKENNPESNASLNDTADINDNSVVDTSKNDIESPRKRDKFNRSDSVNSGSPKRQETVGNEEEAKVEDKNRLNDSTETKMEMDSNMEIEQPADKQDRQNSEETTDTPSDMADIPIPEKTGPIEANTNDAPENTINE